MRVRISIAFIVKCPVRDHSLVHEIFHYVLPYTFDLLFPVHLNGKCDFHLTSHLCIGTFFHSLDTVPKDLSITVFFRCIFRKQDLRHDDSAFSCKVMYESCLFIVQLFAAAICGSGDSRFAAGAADHFDTAVINGHLLSPPSGPSPEVKRLVRPVQNWSQ